VLPIGGLKQKVLAAHAAGITDVIIPERNRADLHDVPEEVREEIRFHPVMSIGEVLDLALEPAAVTRRRSPPRDALPSLPAAPRGGPPRDRSPRAAARARDRLRVPVRRHAVQRVPAGARVRAADDPLGQTRRTGRRRHPRTPRHRLPSAPHRIRTDRARTSAFRTPRQPLLCIDSSITGAPPGNCRHCNVASSSSRDTSAA